MVRYVRDNTGRFQSRPHYQPDELDKECESIITSFTKDLHGEIRYPIDTEDLKKLIERDTADLDVYADLSNYGADVEGVTEFRRSQRPTVKISSALTENDRRENRLRTTLTHEYGHVHFHSYLWEVEQPGQFFDRPNQDKIVCKRDTIVDAAQTDWMEWQAGYVCGAILMPKTAAIALSRKYAEERGLFGPISLRTAHGRALVVAVATTFMVSEEAARLRLIKLGVANESPPTPSLFD